MHKAVRLSCAAFVFISVRFAPGPLLHLQLYGLNRARRNFLRLNDDLRPSLRTVRSRCAYNEKPGLGHR